MASDQSGTGRRSLLARSTAALNVYSLKPPITSGKAHSAGQETRRISGGPIRSGKSVAHDGSSGANGYRPRWSPKSKSR